MTLLSPGEDGPLRVVLVAPSFDYLTELYGFRRGQAGRNQPPLGLGYVAAVVRRAGASVSILDAAAHGWDLPTTTAAILARRPDVVGISAISLEAPAAYALVRALRPRTAAPLVLGGAHASANLDAIPGECPELDALVGGDGEHTMLALCLAVAEGRSFEGIAGLRARRADGSFSPFVERPVVEELDDLPPPAYDLFPHPLYRPLPHRRRRMPATAMITSRGCAYALCTYCEMSLLSRRTFRRNSPSRVVAEMRTLIGLTGARDIYFQDDIFITDPAWVEEFCDRLQAAKLDVIWSCESRFVGVSGALLRQMSRAGCWRIYYGFESGTQELLDGIEKGFTLDEARAAARGAREAGLEVVGFFMLGLPGETPELGRRTIAFAQELDLDHAMFALTVPHPGTELYRICQRSGTIVDDHTYHAKRAAFLPHGYASTEQLERMQARAYLQFYLRPGYAIGQLRRVRSAGDLRYLVQGAVALLGYL
jgi:anaerobic magnesium-protoporphyrin IX monomethyl ester cyclase